MLFKKTRFATTVLLIGGLLFVLSSCSVTTSCGMSKKGAKSKSKQWGW